MGFIIEYLVQNFTEKEYSQQHYPADFVSIGNFFYPLPVGGKINIECKEFGSTFTTADGTKRKDVIKKYKSVAVKYEHLFQDGYAALNAIVNAFENAEYGIQKALFLKKADMPEIAPTSGVKSLFEKINIDVIDPLKFAYKFRSSGLFIYSGLVLKIN